MSHPWYRRAALCCAFTLFAQTVHAQVYVLRPPGVDDAKPRLSSTSTIDGVVQKLDPEAEARKIMEAADESWMNGWTLIGVTALAGGVWAMLQSSNMKDEVWDRLDPLIGTSRFPDDVDKWFEDNSGDARTLERMGYGLMAGGVALMVGGLLFADRGIWVKKTPGGFVAGKTFTLGNKSAAPKKHKARK